MPCRILAAVNSRDHYLMPQRIEPAEKMAIADAKTVLAPQSIRHPAADRDEHGQREHVRGLPTFRSTG